MNPIIRIENISKQYRLGTGSQGAYRTLRETIADAAAVPFRAIMNIAAPRTNGAAPADNPRDFWALKDVSFDVQAGEVVGIIGRNGAGKSTLLKILSRITEPTSGSIAFRGRVASMLEVGTGFHQELTGRENIFLNGAILGMTRREIRRKFHDIVEFSEISEFLDTPVKRYSSGMYVRLAFSVASHLEPEILVVDEVLAVGDAAFQQKCLERMRALKRRGTTILFVSHNMPLIASLCKRAAVLERGSLLGYGETSEQLRLYASMASRRPAADLASRNDRQGNGLIRITGIDAVDASGNRLLAAVAGEALTLRFHYVSNTSLDSIDIIAWVCNEHGARLFVMGNRFSGDVLNAASSSGTLECVIPQLSLAPGRYLIDYRVNHNTDIIDQLSEAASLDVESGAFFPTGRLPAKEHGSFLMRHQWQLTANAPVSSESCNPY